jgi:hypothetical protein
LFSFDLVIPALFQVRLTLFALDHESDVDKDEEGETELIALTEDLKEVDLNHCRIRQIENSFEILKCVEFLGFRNNLIKKIENLNCLVTLRELELYDNQITKIENLDQLVNLE